MKLKPLFIITSSILSIAAISCQTTTSKSKKIGNNNEEIIKRVIQLEEFKLAEKQIDSLKNATGIPFQLTVDVVAQSFYKEDSTKNIALAFINKGVDVEKKIIYIIKYDKDQKKIISVERNEKNFDTKEDSMPPDIKLK